MYKNKIFGIIITTAFCFLIFNQANSYGLDEHISYSLDEILEKVENANVDLKTMDADIKYSRVISLLDSEEVSLGYLQYKKPKKLNLNFFPPRNEINVIDGVYIWIYHLEEKQVEKYEISNDLDSPQGMDIFDLGYEYTTDKAKENYTITLLDDIATEEEALYHIELIPKESFESDYDRILLWIREGLWLPVQYQMFESDGEIINTIELTNIQINPDIPDKIFVLDLPDDVEILEPFK
ncbi:MAG: outer membrane lipoprotein carrier protein LolA [Candidatus Scalindua sp.]|jgi:outer membrane lipoprotein-sorting protein|nr:outer membrane lipoprotein carrier protein LolA [Candidatus Scalindua sp.]MBT5306555.1 outer membrane lipoprotein carrier protein LolA [Candidatus Scalindua sp.]MBT6228410.1 outer membrane lipoprotein carrier protein LolA [Candidatus Scalindua sp.]MBT6563896.1 outer membrane lipoprotein carrier protein LolA [Candidatus Scalindua sp.]MBT7213360.1 outer membrane lipoprotein carrier protein LolA [Candidatus Scalindua sp.]